MASHWHDDHVRGLAELLAAYPNAELQVSSVFSDREAQAFLATYSGENAPLLTRGTRELFQAFKRRTVVPTVKQRSIVADVALPGVGGRVLVTAFSPTHQACASTLARMASYIPSPSGKTPIGHAPDLQPNEESVVIHIEWPNQAALLGSDLEGKGQYGWQAVTADGWCKSRAKAGLYKVAHHGSKSGDHPTIWSTLLSSKPIAVLTPFNLGGCRLPTVEDRQRLKYVANSVHTTSGATYKPELTHDQVKRLSQMCRKLSRASPGFGAVRLRRRPTERAWRVEHFGSATAL